MAGHGYKLWTEAEIEKLKELAPEHSHAVTAGKLGRTKKSVALKYKRLSAEGKTPKRRRWIGNDVTITMRNNEIIELPAKYLDMMRANADKALVISDIHLPCIDWSLFDKLLKTAKRQDVRTCVVGGDLFDLTLFSHFPDSHSHGPEELTMGQKAAVKFFSMLLDQFDKVYVICGNHDFRVFGFSRGKITENIFFEFMTKISRQEKRVEFSAYRHMILNEDWRIVHPNCGGSNFHVEGLREAVKYQQNIVMTHVHRMGWVFDPSGKLIVAGSGALLDPTTQAYVMTIPSGTPMWNTGGLIICRGEKIPVLLPKYRTDWELWTNRRFL